MDLTIYSIGDAYWIFQILSGVARIFDYQHSVLSVLVGTAAGLGLIGLVVTAWLNPQSNPIQSWFVGLLLFMILLGPLSKTNVTIESVRTGETYVVDDVPAIASIAGFMTSSLMYGLSTEYENNWGNIDGYRAGQFLDPYRAMLELEMFGVLNAEAAKAGKDPRVYAVETSLTSYIRNCVVWDLKKPDAYAEITMSYLRNASMDELWPNMRVKTPTRYAKVGVDGPLKYETCPVAYEKLTRWFDSAVFKRSVHDYLRSKGLESNYIDGVTETITAGRAAMSAVELAQGRVAANKLIQELQEQGNSLGVNAEIALMQSKVQRQYQMASDRALWLELSIGFATFLEGFVFFLLPIMAILMVLGGQMLQACITFFGVSLWVSLWPVTMVAVNFFTELTLEGRFQGAMAESALTFGMFANSTATIESYLAVSSALAAAVPMLSMYILHRGVHTMMGVGGKVTPDTNVDSGQLAPNLTSTSAGTVTEGNTKYSMIAGGNGGKITDINLGSASAGASELTTSVTNNQGVNAAKVTAQTAAEKYEQAASASYSRMSKAMKSHGNNVTLGELMSSGLTRTEAASVITAKALAEKNDIKESDALKFVAQAAGGMELGAKGGVSTSGNQGGGTSSGASASVSGGGKLSAGLTLASEGSKTHTLSKDYSDSQQASLQNQASAMLQNNISRADSEAYTNSSAFESSNQTAQSQTQAITDVIQSSNQLSKLQGQNIASTITNSGIAAEVINSPNTVAPKAAINDVVDNLSDDEAAVVYSQLASGEESSKPNFMANVAKNDHGKTPQGETITNKDRLKSRLNDMQNDESNLLRSAWSSKSYSSQQLDNGSVWNTGAKVIAALSGNTEMPEQYDEQGKKRALRPDDVTKFNANEKNAQEKMLRSIGGTYNAASVLAVAEAFGKTGLDQQEEMRTPTLIANRKELIDGKNIKTNVDDNIPTAPPKTPAIEANFAENQGVIKNKNDEAQDKIAGKGDVIAGTVTAENEDNKQLLAVGGSAVKPIKEVSEDALSAVSSMLSDPGQDIQNKIMGSANSMVDDGFDLLQNSTPSQIQEILSKAEVGGVDNLESTRQAQALHMAMAPQAQSAYTQYKASGDASFNEHNGSNAFGKIDAGIEAMQQYKANNADDENYQRSELIARYATDNNLNEEHTTDAFDVANGEGNTITNLLSGSNRDMATNLANLNAYAGATGSDLTFSNVDYNEDAKEITDKNQQGSSTLLRMSNMDDDVNKIAVSAISSGGSASSEESRVSLSDLTPSKYSELFKTANNMDNIGDEQAADKIRATTTSIGKEDYLSNGDNSAWSQYSSQATEAALNVPEVPDSARLLAQSVLNGEGVPNSISKEDREGIQEVADQLRMSGIVDRANQLESALLSSLDEPETPKEG